MYRYEQLYTIIDSKHNISNTKYTIPLLHRALSSGLFWISILNMFSIYVHGHKFQIYHLKYQIHWPTLSTDCYSLFLPDFFEFSFWKSSVCTKYLVHSSSVALTCSFSLFKIIMNSLSVLFRRKLYYQMVYQPFMQYNDIYWCGSQIIFCRLN